MARYRKDAEAKKYPYGGGRIEGNLAYNLDYEEKRQKREERRVREETAPHKVQRQKARTQTAVHARPRQKMSAAALVSFSMIAVMVLALVMSYARLAEISSSVVAMTDELTDLKSEYVSLLTRYEQTFDISTVKETAEASGMAKPSASQIFYVDLSEPDSAVVYQADGGSVFSRVFTSLGHGMCSVVEYFK